MRLPTRLRTLLTIGAAVVAVGPFGLTPTAHATAPHGPIAGVTVNGDSTTGTAPIEGTYKSGTMSYAGFTAGCAAGSVGGAVDRGTNTAPRLRFNALDLTCDSPLGDDATITLDTTRPGCSTIDTTLADHRVHTGNAPGDIDTGNPTGEPGNVTGTGTIGGQCIAVTILGGCTFRIDGTFDLQLDEAIKTSGGINYQDVILTGTGLRTLNPHTYCFGLVPNNSTITLNNLTFKVHVTGGTTTGIDVTAAPGGDPGGPITGIAVNGFDAAGTKLVAGNLTSGSMGWAGIPNGWCYGTGTGPSLEGTVNRGPRATPPAPDLTITSLNISCYSPFDDAYMSLAEGCNIKAYMSDDHVHPGLIDTGTTGGDPDPVDGYAVVPPSCIVAHASGGPGCTFRIHGTIGLQFKEAPKTVGGVTYQELVMRGNGLTTYKPSLGCLGFIPNGGAVALNDLTFNVRVAGIVGSVVTPGTPPTGAIDFYH